MLDFIHSTMYNNSIETKQRRTNYARIKNQSQRTRQIFLR